jgi:hypothetical protein
MKSLEVYSFLAILNFFFSSGASITILHSCMARWQPPSPPGTCREQQSLRKCGSATAEVEVASIYGFRINWYLVVFLDCYCACSHKLLRPAILSHASRRHFLALRLLKGRPTRVVQAWRND